MNERNLLYLIIILYIMIILDYHVITLYKVKLNLELNAVVIHEQSIFIQIYASNTGGVLHAPILDK